MNFGRTSRASLLVEWKHAAGFLFNLLTLINHTDYFLTQTPQIYAEAMQNRRGFIRSTRRGAHAHACALPSGGQHTSEAMYVSAKSFMDYCCPVNASNSMNIKMFEWYKPHSLDDSPERG